MDANFFAAVTSIATVLLVGGLFFAWRNVIAINADSAVRRDRAAREKAIEAAGLYLNSFVKIYDELCAWDDFKNLPEYEGEIGDFSAKSLTRPSFKIAQQKVRLGKVHPVLNRLELISAYFVTGVADECEGFRIIGRSFCQTVEYEYDIIAVCRSDPGQQYWYNIVRLYETWRPRLKMTEIDSTVEELEGVLSKLKTEKDQTSPPIRSGH